MSPKLSPTGVMGERPFTYSEKKTRHFSEEAIVRTYELAIADSFEEGDAYSLHADVRHAQKFKPSTWWYWTGGPEIVYVSKQVLDAIDNKRGKSIFVE